jgi:hypothetical protein
LDRVVSVRAKARRSATNGRRAGMTFMPARDTCCAI